jgi:hypothetical protein
MKVSSKLSSVSVCILVSLLLVFLTNAGPTKAADTQTTGVYEEGAAGSAHDASDLWAGAGEEENQQSGYEGQQGEEPADEGGAESVNAPSEEDEGGSGSVNVPPDEEEGGAESVNAPPDEEHPSDTDEPSEEETLPPNPQGDDDLAQAPAAE